MAETTAQKTSGKRFEYHILATRNQTHEFKITATSPEHACEALEQKLKSNPTLDELSKYGARVQFSSWSDPNEKGEEWIVGGGDILVDEVDGTFMFWDGKKLTRKKIGQ